MLIGRVLESNLDKALKTTLIDGLGEIKQAILDYRLFGAESIRNAVDRNLGGYARYERFITRVNYVLSIALRFRPIASPILRALTSVVGSEGEDVSE